MSTGPTLRWWFDALAVIHIDAERSGGALSLIEVVEPAGAGAPTHVHHREDETFHVLEGTVTIVVADRSIPLGVGDTAFGPRGVPHSYTVGPTGCRMLHVCTPGGFERFVMATSRPAGSATLPPPSAEETDWAAVAAAARAHGCELLG